MSDRPCLSQLAIKLVFLFVLFAGGSGRHLEQSCCMFSEVIAPVGDMVYYQHLHFRSCVSVKPCSQCVSTAGRFKRDSEVENRGGRWWQVGEKKSSLNIKFGFYQIIPDTCLTCEIWSCFKWQSSVKVDMQGSPENTARQFDLDKVQLVSERWGVESGWLLLIWGWWQGEVGVRWGGVTCMVRNSAQPAPEKMGQDTFFMNAPSKVNDLKNTMCKMSRWSSSTILSIPTYKAHHNSS